MLELLDLFDTAAFTLYQTVFPNIQPEHTSLVTVALVALFTLVLYVSRCIFKPHTKGDLEKAVAAETKNGDEHYTQVIDRMERNHNSHIATKDTTIRDHNNVIAKLRAHNADLEAQLLAPVSLSKGGFQRERMIATLAVELEGFAAVEAQADRLVEALK